MLYFASDFHLGVPDYNSSLTREKKIISWLESIAPDAKEIYLVGDVFDFWFEYKTAVPKGFVRLLGCLATLADAGIKIHFFAGNHDMWFRNYLHDEIGLQLHKDEYRFESSGKKFYVAHGDGLGPGDKGYRMLKKVFRSPLCQWLFRQLHPDVGIRLANYFSKRSRLQQKNEVLPFLGNEREWLVQFCNQTLEHESPDVDYFIFGHRHLPLDIVLKNGHSRYINLGDWINHCNYAIFDGHNLALKRFH